MKRLLLAAVVLFTGHCGLASADYVIIKVDLNTFLHGTRPPLLVQPKPPANQGPGGKGGGFGGQQGGLPPPILIPPPVDPGQGGQPDPSGKAQQPTSKFPPLYVHGYFEVKPEKKLPNPRPQYFVLEHKPADSKSVPLHLADKYAKVIPTGWQVSAQFVTMMDKVIFGLRAGVDDEKKRQLVDMAEWALQRGLPAEFKKCIDELKKVDPKHAVVASIERLADQLKKAPSKDDPGAKALMDELMQKEGYKAAISEQGHYILLSNIRARDREDEIKRKLVKLETLYTTFFTWHALRGRPLTPPDHRLVVVLMDAPPADPRGFLSRHAAYNHVPMVAAGFTARRDNVVYLASHRFDEAYVKLNAYNQEQCEKYHITVPDLVGNFATLQKNLQASYGKNPELYMDKFSELLELHILALCQKSMEDENEMVALSHEGVRQLIAAAGVLPRDVQTAEWLRSGLASFFEVPPRAFFPSTAGANWDHLVRFKAMAKDRKIDKKDASDLLLEIVGDDMFRKANLLSDESLRSREAKDKLGPLAKQQQDFARTMSWSLVHFLAHKRDKEFGRYLDQVNRLPRDLDYSGKVLRDCFLRTFDLVSENPDKLGQYTIKTNELDTLAQEWFRYTEVIVSLDASYYEGLAIAELVSPDKLAPGVIQPSTGGKQGSGGFGGPGGQGGQGGQIPPGIGGPPGQGGLPPVQGGLPPDKK